MNTPQGLLSLLDLDDSQLAEEVYLNHGFFLKKVKRSRKVIGPDYRFWHNLNNKFLDMMSFQLQTHIWVLYWPSSE